MGPDGKLRGEPRSGPLACGFTYRVCTVVEVVEAPDSQLVFLRSDPSFELSYIQLVAGGEGGYVHMYTKSTGHTKPDKCAPWIIRRDGGCRRLKSGEVVCATLWGKTVIG
jgi:hypothetical protein